MSCTKLVRGTWRALSKSIVLASVSFLTRCVEPYAPPIITDDFGLLVVDGFFVGNDSSFLKLSRTQELESEVTSRPELHATVVVQSECGSEFQFKELGNGRYGFPNLNVDASLKYKMWIRTDDTDEYESDFVLTFELIGYSYSTVECLDCRIKGGVTTRPDYWYD